MRASHLLSIVLIVVIAVLAGALSQRYAVSADWTYGNRNSLAAASARVLAALDDGPITFTAYVYPGPQRDRVRARLSRYTRADRSVTLTFRDPARHPQQVRTLGIGEDGAVQLRYQGRSQTVSDYSEESVTNALQRLSTDTRQWVVFLTGHGERAPDDKSSGGYSELAAALDAQGMTTRTLNLAEAAAIPDNAALLVIASPQRDLLPGEVQLIRAYVDAGGSLLWADDPGPRYGLVPLAQSLGIHWQRGTLVYPDYRKLGTGHPAIALVANYPHTPITDHLNQLSLFPFAGALDTLADSPWKTNVFLRSTTRSWLETGALDKASLTYEPDKGDRAGPLDMGIALTRSTPGNAPDARQQRAAVIADSDFMANGHLSNLGNRALALSVFQWLTHRDAQIAVDVAEAPDASLQIAPARIRLLWWVFVLMLPLALLAIGLTRWWLRRRR
ncbi:GldG family protein [Salinisphaera aquimarina]|uniref:GldG family protein n=1 Tax=Salinisphaera aquimarina TaxID=2094031 RepID=A0ABV7ET60_9GAMM